MHFRIKYTKMENHINSKLNTYIGLFTKLNPIFLFKKTILGNSTKFERKEKKQFIYSK